MELKMHSHMVWMIACCVVANLLCSVPVRADYEAGHNAWQAGRHAEALRQWQSAAGAGDARAMLALGRAYVKGLGVQQDYVEAHKWLNLAAARGNSEGAAERDALAEKMSLEEQAEARKLARAWRPGSGVTAPETVETPPAAARAPQSKPAPSPQRSSQRTAKPASRAPSPQAGPPPPRAIREAQALMTALGYKPGPADGQWGPRTGRAYAAFLRDTGLAPGNMLTPDALRAMRAAAKGRRVTVPAASARQGTATRREAKASRPARSLGRLVAAGDLVGLKAALARGAKPNDRDGKGWTALMHAADKGLTLMVPPLLKAGADPNVRAPDGATALFMAAVQSHWEIVEALMAAGADLAIKGPKGLTAESLIPPSLWRAGHEFRDCGRCPEMVVVPAGSYWMGSSAGEKGRYDDEGPRHEVRIRTRFAVGKYEVTFGEWDACVAEGGCRGHRPSDEGWGRGKLPAIDVSWADAHAYVKWLSRTTGKGYRLLSEAEWEYVARAGSSTRYWWGDEVGRSRANCGGCGSRWDDDWTAPVGSFEANAFGVYDVHGNVWEWVKDCWRPNYGGAPTDGSAWTTGENCQRRVLRGGSWSSKPRNLRSANRLKDRAGNRDYFSGFRVARTLTP